MPYAPRRHQAAGLPDPPRQSAARRGYGHRWRKYRAAYLSQPEHVVCSVPCCNRLATVVDHKRPHRGDPRLFWDPDNHQPMCKHHHDQKTATEDGGLGHPGTGRGPEVAP